MIEGVGRLGLKSSPVGVPSRSPSSTFHSLPGSSPIGVSSASAASGRTPSASPLSGRFSPRDFVQEAPTPTNNGRASIDSTTMREKNMKWANMLNVNPAGANKFNAVDVEQAEGTENNAIVFAGDDETSDDESCFGESGGVHGGTMGGRIPRKRVTYPRNLTLELAEAKDELDRIRRDKENVDNERNDNHEWVGGKERQRQDYMYERDREENRLREIRNEVDNAKAHSLFGNIRDAVDDLWGTPRQKKEQKLAELEAKYARKLKKHDLL